MAQAPAIEWQKCLGGSSYEQSTVIITTSDGGYALLSESQSNDGDVQNHHGERDLWVVKLNTNGIVEWQKTLGGSAMELPFWIVQTSDDGYVILGLTGSSDGDVTGHHGGNDLWVVKLNSGGELAWQKTLGGSGSEWITMYTAYGRERVLAQTPDGGFVVAGLTLSSDGDVTGSHGQSDGWVVKLSSAGALEWQRCLGGSGSDEMTSVSIDADGGIVLAGNTGSSDGDIIGFHGDYDSWVVKLNGSGEILWQRALGGTELDMGMDVVGTPDGGYMVASVTSSIDGDVNASSGFYDWWIVKLDSSGGLAWEQAYGGGNGQEFYPRLQAAPDGGWFVWGATGSDDGDVVGHHGLLEFEDFWVLRLDPSGELVWQKCLGSTGEDFPMALRTTADGGCLLVGSGAMNDGDVSGGFGEGDAWAVKLGASGAIQWQKPLGGSAPDVATSVQHTTDGGYILAGSTASSNGNVQGSHGATDSWVVKLSDATSLQEPVVPLFLVGPVPTTNVLRISSKASFAQARIVLTDLLGREVLHADKTVLPATLSVGHLQRGMYTVTLSTAQRTQALRILLE